ncbi:hypothetical protein [Roseimicrobium sp. ORNL1]|uniref:hypothetical protein n=1 Tax=Roseimicrobium sp. ORNL1 TaxID=2711231 RepID=UPI0013E1F54F|nr:hypothetical protein [Roseimicrobium sp. ORNL1]QIF02847.1 hypothetical protein G5S37_15400 [Roseimicrobium sp. ORNL1]
MPALILAALSLLASPRLAEAQGSPRAALQKPSAALLKGESVFYASHSLMWYVPEPLRELAAAAGIQGHELVGLQKIGASRTLQHWELPEGENQAKHALEAGKVGAFVMSPIQFPDEGVENFVKLGLKQNPDVRFIVQLSWGGGDTDNQDFPKGSRNNGHREKNPVQLKKLYERNISAGERQADEINRKYGHGKRIMTLVPTAQALVTLRTKIYQKQMPGLNSQSELFVDAAHPSPPLEALNAYLHFAVLYGRSPVGLPMVSVLKKANRADWDEKLNRMLQEIAWQTAVNYPYTGLSPVGRK